MKTATRTARTFSAVAAMAVTGALALAGCSDGDDQDLSATQAPSEMATGNDMAHDHDHGEHGDHGDHGGHDHGDHAGHEHKADGGPAPEGIALEDTPTYPAGTMVQLDADHMPGMKGSPATIVGAFKTYTYAIDYTPVGGGEPVKNHKWIVQEEIKDAGAERLADGTEVTVLADHMTGMEGATATIVSSTEETVYMVDVDSPDMPMKNHKWVTESEIKPAQ